MSYIRFNRGHLFELVDSHLSDLFSSWHRIFFRDWFNGLFDLLLLALELLFEFVGTARCAAEQAARGYGATIMLGRTYISFYDFDSGSTGGGGAPDGGGGAPLAVSRMVKHTADEPPRARPWGGLRALLLGAPCCSALCSPSAGLLGLSAARRFACSRLGVAGASRGSVTLAQKAQQQQQMQNHTISRSTPTASHS